MKKWIIIIVSLFPVSSIAELEIITESTATVYSQTGQTIIQSGENFASQSVKGKELSFYQCGRLVGRDSSATADVKSRVVYKKKNIGSVELSNDIRTNGGYVRTCGLCVYSAWCIDVDGMDTKAGSAAKSKAIFRFELDESNMNSDQVISITAQNSDVLKDPRLKIKAIGGDDFTKVHENEIQILVKPKPEYLGTVTVYLELQSAAENEGGSGDNNSSISGVFTVSMQNAALLESMYIMYPKMVQGEKETAFPGVGLIEIQDEINKAKWKPHCTGTLISETTVLTAAHCLVELNERTKVKLKDHSKMRFIIGQDNKDPKNIKRNVSKLIIPNGTDGSPHQYIHWDDSHTDDIALIKLNEALTDIESYSLHTGTPSLESIIKEGETLRFIGFGGIRNWGFDKGVGAKHYLELKIRNLRLRTFENRKDVEKTTCYGDSGGPAFVKSNNNKYLIAGVISKGDENCRSNGVNTRVKNYENWINQNI